MHKILWGIREVLNWVIGVPLITLWLLGLGTWWLVCRVTECPEVLEELDDWPERK